MTIKERLELLAKDNFMVMHCPMGPMLNELIRIKEIPKKKETAINEHGHMNCYCKFIHAEYSDDNNIYQDISENILNRELIHEEVWMISGQCSLDLFVKEV